MTPTSPRTWPVYLDGAPPVVHKCVTHHACACHEWMADQWREQAEAALGEALPLLRALVLGEGDGVVHLSACDCRNHQGARAFLAAHPAPQGEVEW